MADAGELALRQVEVGAVSELRADHRKVRTALMELTEEQYRKYRINFLYYFAHVNHMASILAYGLMPRNRAQNREYITSDISNQEVQARRADRQVFGRSLHDYVPLYFTPKNPGMLYAIRDIQDEVVILSFRREILSQGGTVFTDGNSQVCQPDFFGIRKTLISSIGTVFVLTDGMDTTTDDENAVQKYWCLGQFRPTKFGN